MSLKQAIESTAVFIVGLAWRIIVIAAVVYLIMQGIRISYSYGHGLLYDHAMTAAPGTEISFVIEDGDTVRDISGKLQKEGLIDNTDAFYIQTKLYKGKYESGTYILNTSMKLSEIISFLTAEGQKIAELKEKKLIDEKKAEEMESVPETDENGAEIIGGNTDEQDAVDEDQLKAMESQSGEGLHMGGNATARE